MTGSKSSASRTAAATAARRALRGAPDMEDLAAEDPPQKPRPKPTKKKPRSSVNSLASGEVDSSLSQRQEVSNEPETLNEDDSRDIQDHNNSWDNARSGSIDGDLNGDYDHGRDYSRDNSVGHNGEGSNEDEYSSRGVDEIRDQRSGHSKPTPALDEYGSEPELYLQQDGESTTSPATNTNSY